MESAFSCTFSLSSDVSFAALVENTVCTLPCGLQMCQVHFVRLGVLFGKTLGSRPYIRLIFLMYAKQTKSWPFVSSIAPCVTSSCFVRYVPLFVFAVHFLL